MSGSAIWALPVMALLAGLLVCAEVSAIPTCVIAAVIGVALVGNSIVVSCLKLAFRPIAPLERILDFIYIPAAIYNLMGETFEYLGKARASEALIKRGSRYSQRAHRYIGLVPVEEVRLVPFLLFVWLVVGGVVVVAYGVCFHSLGAVGVDCLTAGGNPLSLGAALLASTSFFTTAPLTELRPVGGLGAALSVLEAVDSLLLLVVFISLFVRALSGDAQTGLRSLREQKQDYLNELETQSTEGAKRLDSLLSRLHVSANDAEPRRDPLNGKD